MALAEIAEWMPLGGIVDAAGDCTLTFRGRSSQRLVVVQVAVEMVGGAAGALCSIRLNGNLVSPAVATGDAAAGDPPIPVFPGDELTVEFTGGAPGVACRATVFWRAEL